MKSIYMDKLPVAKKISKEVICLPIYPDLSMDQVNYIISVINDG
jgi:dTDP-4-amino-4,6-dideoxygalactose transaminase